MKLQLLLLTAAGVAAPAAADPILLYENDFEAGVIGVQWSPGAKLETAPAFSTYLGRYTTNQGITLTVSTPPWPAGDGVIVPPDDGGGGGDGGGDGGDGGGDGGDGGGDGGDGGGDGGDGGPPPIDPYPVFTLVFDLYAIDSWDGSEETYGPDHFRVTANGATIFDETIANQHDGQTMRDPDVGPEQLGYNYYNDSIYRDVSISFTLDPYGEEMHLAFAGAGLLALNDESWGIDNVRVYYDVVPAPGAMALIGLGALASVGRRRR